eukprot:210887_1
MATATLLLTLLLTYYYGTTASNHNCGSWGCYRDTITCTNNQDCTVQCTSSHSCDQATINCPLNGNCYITCSGSNSCDSSIINGNTNMLLNVTCTADSACIDATFNGKTNEIINILCGNRYACYKAKFDARNAAKLNLMDCATDSYTCIGIIVYCPPKVHNDKKCIIQGDNSLGSWDSETITFYAINSWNDIQFQDTLKDNYYAGKMYCTTDYSHNCDISSCCGWQCNPTSALCQNPPTLAPTFNPSITPTKFPTKSPTITTSPTKFPSLMPTITPTYNPSYNPSYYPSNNPTYNPATIPTSIPTFSPSEIPTKSPVTHLPSVTPSQYPTNIPSTTPTKNPSNNPSQSPTDIPSKNPSYNPSIHPTISPSYIPSKYPSHSPTTSIPSHSPTNKPTPLPTDGVNLIITEHIQPSTTVTKIEASNVELITTHIINTIDSGEAKHNGNVTNIVNNKYASYILIGISMVVTFICLECIYCFCCKRKKRKPIEKQKQKSIKSIPTIEDEGNTTETQMIPIKKIPMSILPAPPKRTKQTESLLNKQTNGNISIFSIISDDLITPQFPVTNIENGHYKQAASNSFMITPGGYVSNDMQIIGDDEYNNDAIITKQNTFEDAENDQEIMSEERSQRRTKKYTMKSEGDRLKQKKITITDIYLCNQDETIGYPLDDEIGNNDLIIGINNETIGDVMTTPVTTPLYTPFGGLDMEEDVEEQPLNDNDIITIDAPADFGSLDDIQTIQ